MVVFYIALVRIVASDSMFVNKWVLNECSKMFITLVIDNCTLPSFLLGGATFSNLA